MLDRSRLSVLVVATLTGAALLAGGLSLAPAAGASTPSTARTTGKSAKSAATAKSAKPAKSATAAAKATTKAPAKTAAKAPAASVPSTSLARYAAATSTSSAKVVSASSTTSAASPTVTVPAGNVPVVTTANSFDDSVGVNVHTYYNDTAYADANRVTTLLRNLGVRHVRDGLAAGRPDEVSALQMLGQAGIRSSLILSGTGGGDGTAPTVDPGQISELRTLAPYVDSVEPTNEYDCSGDSNWAADLHTYVGNLVQTLQADATLKSLPVLAPAFCRPESVAAYGSVTNTASATNAHDYAGGQAPELALEGRLPGFAATQQADLPAVVTETGYTNAVNAGWNAVTESTAADYVVRTLLDARRLGVARTYLYELFDEKPDSALDDPEQHFGLVRNDGSVKPAYTAVQNLLTDVSRGSPWSVNASTQAAAPVTVAVHGGGSLVRSLVTTDPNGGGETLALWLATPLEDPSTHQALTDPTRLVQVTSSAAVSATAQQPSRGNATSTVGTGTAFEIPVSGAVTLLHLSTQASGSAATCTASPSYTQLATSYGASVVNDLSPKTGWSATPGTATGLAESLTTGSQITASGQQTHVTVPGSPGQWTIALWERTDPSSASYATFLQATGASGALLRTYDMADDVPSHMQLSGYGTPTGGASYGNEVVGQALPGSWHLVALSDDGSTVTLSVDGQVAGTAASSAYPLTGLDVGSLAPGFRGAVGGLRVFPKALTASQLGALATTYGVSC